MVSNLENKDFLNYAKDITDNLLIECDKNNSLMLLLDDVSFELSTKKVNTDALGKLFVLIEILKKNNDYNVTLLNKLWDNLIKIDN